MSGRIRQKRRPRLLALIVVALGIGFAWWWEDRLLLQSGWQRPRGKLTSGEYKVARVIDGDTLVLQQEDLRVRLQGVDTPETVKANSPVESWGPEAKEYTERFLLSADWLVRIEIDGEPVDRYGRHLAFVLHEGRLLNEELVSQGLAHAKTDFDFSQPMKQRLRKAQQEAEANRRGIWSSQ